MRISSNVAIGSPMARVAAIMVATLLLALTVAGAGIAGSRLLAADGTIVVAQDGSGTYATITEAVAAANDGDTVLVKPGTYVEAVTIAKDIA
jgi:pectin methylesterase-like acyl-CoA thioesterase